MTYVYDFRDAVTGGYSGFLFIAKSDEAAKRWVRVCLETKKGLPGLILDSRQDFTLYCLGSYDDACGALFPELRMVNHLQEVQDARNENL